MKISATLTMISLGLIAAAAPVLQGAEKNPEAMISHAYSVFTTSGATTGVIKAALVEILDASLLILPKTDYADEYKSRIDVAKKLFEETSLFNEKARQYVGLAYRLVAGGTVWQMPKEMTTVYRAKDITEQAQKICKGLIDEALAAWKAGRNETSVRYLLEFVLMVITPVPA